MFVFVVVNLIDNACILPLFDIVFFELDGMNS